MRTLPLIFVGALLIASCGGEVGIQTTSASAPTTAPASTTSTAAPATTQVSSTTSATTTAAPTTTVGQVLEPAPTTDLVGTYYYPWYGADFHGGGYLREYLAPAQLPALGEYDDRRSEVVAQHLEWSRRAGIDVWITSWWGRSSSEDRTIRQVILPHPDLGATRIAIMYETTGTTAEFSDLDGIASDFGHLARNFFSHPAYFSIEGRPVVVVYLTRVLADRDLLDTAVGEMRAGAAGEGYDVFIVGDHAFGAPRSGTGIEALDAITNYDVYGAMGASGYATPSDVARYASDQQGWNDLAVAAGAGFVPAASPGFNDTGVRDGHDPLARSLVGEEPGSLFRELLDAAASQRDDRVGGLVLINSWNEWHEDTQIEPVAAAPVTTGDDSASGTAFTFGLPYEGYGTRYLDILREALGG